MEGLTPNAIIAIGGVIVTIIGGWYTMKGIVKALSEKMESLTKQVTALWENKDDNVEELAELKNEGLWLRRDVDELRDEQKYQRRRLDA